MPSNSIGRSLRRAAIGITAALSAAFLIVHAARSHADRALARDTEEMTVPAVDVTAVDAAADGSLTLPGETAGWYESTIYARVSGYVANWYVNIGERVGAGQLLASIDTPELDAELTAAQAKLKATRAQVKVRAAAADFARSSYARWRDSPRGVVSEQEREDKKAADASAAAELEAARAEVALDRADVDRLSALQRFKRVVAPYAGTIVQRHVDIGDLVTAGSAANNSPLYRMVQDDPMRVFVDVPQSAAADLMKIGVPARISVMGSPGSAVTGSIARTSDAIDPKARTFRAELDLSNTARRLVAGQYVQVAFLLQDHGLNQVPAAALVFRAGGPEVAELAADGRVHFHAVTIARDDGDTVELSSGVAKGDRLVLNISSAITEGEKARAVAGAASKGTLALRAH